MRSMQSFACTAVLSSAFVCSLAVAQDAKKPADAKPAEKPAAAPAQPSAEDMQKMMEGMKKWLASIKPGKNHETLNQFVGSWDTVTRMWMAGPGSAPAESKGVSDVKWVLGKRFVQEEHKGEMLMPDESGAIKQIPYEGLGLWGYDNTRNMFVGTWASTAGTNLLTMAGSAEPGGKQIRYFGEMDEPMLDMYGRMVKYEVKVESNDKHVMTIYDLAAGDSYKVVEIIYTRKK